ncbi:MAG: glycosyltransferase [Bacteroidetes bacterium]|nr:glycosyltransferase [Bacteroidota bacterium]
MGLFLLGSFFLFGLLIQGVFLLVVFGRTAWYSSSSKKSAVTYPEEGVTVLVTARNKYQYLKVLIPKLFEQDYPKFDVLIVNDQSTDRTKRLLEDLLIKYPKLRSVTIKYTPKHLTAKKFALTLGFKVAKNDVILLTEADSLPSSNQWIRKMTAPVREQGKTFALGYSGYTQPSSTLGRWVKFESLLKALFFLSFSLWKAPFMGVGRNLCYRKSFFMEVKAFKGFWDVQGGEDALFVNAYATGKNTQVVIDPQAITTSECTENWKEYLAQEKQVFQAERNLKVEDKRKVGIYAISQALYWIGGIGLLLYFGIGFDWIQFSFVLACMLARTLLLSRVIRSATFKLEGTRPTFNVLLFDLIYIAYFWVLGSISYQAKNMK